MHVYSVYLVDGVGLSEVNLSVLAEVAAVLGILSGPWIVAGDRNVNPQFLLDSGWLDVAGEKCLDHPPYMQWIHI